MIHHTLLQTSIASIPDGLGADFEAKLDAEFARIADITDGVPVFDGDTFSNGGPNDVSKLARDNRNREVTIIQMARRQPQLPDVQYYDMLRELGGVDSQGARRGWPRARDQAPQGARLRAHAPAFQHEAAPGRHWRPIACRWCVESARN